MERTERVDGLPNDVDALKELIDERMARARTAPRRKGAHMSDVKVTTLANGLRVAVDDDARGRIGLARHLGRLRHAPRDRPS